MAQKSPLAPERFPPLPPIAGVEVAGAPCGLKESGRHDLFVARLAPGTAVAGSFTRSLCPSAPVDWCRRILPGGRARCVVVNSGNANAFTGKAGDRTVEHTVRGAAQLFGCPADEVYIASTGVIGVPVPADYIASKLPALSRRLSADAWLDAARGIMTTDTFPKGAVRTARIGDAEVTVAGIAKGSGMIAPDMATMLGFIFTDAAIPAPVLQALLTRAVDDSFNSITVDGDTSTSDTVLLFATGQAGNAVLTTRDDPGADALYAAIREVALDLAQQVVRDGEGASKFIEVQVSGAVSDDSARRVALSIANSPLVKTAIAGEDANWGRVVMAVGKAGEPADRDKLAIRFGDHWVAKDGLPVDGYDEAPVAAHLKGQDIRIGADLGLGEGCATVWTCDLTHGYISINADYRS